MKRSEHYTDWDGICKRCGHSYFECRGNCTCFSCMAQRQTEVEAGLVFDEDAGEEDYMKEILDSKHKRGTFLNCSHGRIRLTWTDQHSASSYGLGVLLLPEGNPLGVDILDGATFQALHAVEHAVIVTDNRARVLGALGLPEGTPGVRCWPK